MSDTQNLATPVSAGEASRLLTKKELADVLRCSERQIERLQLARKIPFILLSKKMIRYRRDSVLRALLKMEPEALG